MHNLNWINNNQVHIIPHAFRNLCNSPQKTGRKLSRIQSLHLLIKMNLKNLKIYIIIASPQSRDKQQYKAKTGVRR